jgi:transcriptional regulator with XRE-family HTH domain
MFPQQTVYLINNRDYHVNPGQTRSGERVDREHFYGVVGGRVRSQRRRKHLTQQQLADSVGLSRASIANIEGGRQKVLLHQIYELASALGVEPTALLPAALQRTDVNEMLSNIPGLSEDGREWIKKIVGSRTSEGRRDEN